MLYIKTNDQNIFCGLYDSEFHSDIPSDAIEVTEEQFQYFIENQHLTLCFDKVKKEIYEYKIPFNIDVEKSKILYSIERNFNDEVKLGCTVTVKIKSKTVLIKMDCQETSVAKLKAGYDLAILIGDMSMDIIDFNNQTKTVPIDQCLEIIKQQAAAFRVLKTKRDLLRSKASTAASKIQLDKITW